MDTRVLNHPLQLGSLSQNVIQFWAELILHLRLGGAVKTRVFFMFSMFPQLLPLSCKVSHMGVYTCHGHDALHCGMAKIILAVVLAAEQGTQWARYDVGF